MVVELPRYVRIRNTVADADSLNYTVEEDEIVLLETIKDDEW